MDRALSAAWYDLGDIDRGEYLQWMHERHLPALLKRPGILWVAHVENDMSPERDAIQNARRAHITDGSVPGGLEYLVLVGAETAGPLVYPRPADYEASLDDYSRSLLARRVGLRTNIFVEVERVDGPDVALRPEGTAPGPIVQLGTFNSNAPQFELELSTWFSRSRLPLVQGRKGIVGARKLVAIDGWAKHGILYEMSSLDVVDEVMKDGSEWSERVLGTVTHGPHSPSLGPRIWP
jgi:hypothetical protein